MPCSCCSCRMSSTVADVSVADMPAVGSASRRSFAAEADRSGVGGKGAGDDVEQRGLAATVGADDAAQLPGADGQVDPPQDVEPAEPLGDPADLEERWGHGTRPATITPCTGSAP